MISEVGPGGSKVDIYLVVILTEVGVNSTLHVNFMIIVDQLAG